MTEKPILPFRESEAQASVDQSGKEKVSAAGEPAAVLPRERSWEDARKARRRRKRSEAREIEQSREYLGEPASLTMSRQEVYHWNRDDQIRDLVRVRDGAPEMGFMMRLLALCTLPRTDPGDRQQYRRVNGPFKLFMIAGGDTRLPYGTLPRLLLAWVCTEAVRTGSRTLVLGRSLSEFMRRLGMDPSGGGKRGDRTRIQNQMERLFSATVQVRYEDAERSSMRGLVVADATEFWWETRRDHPVLWESTIRLSEVFFAEVLRGSVPLDVGVLRAMKRSSLGLDLYLWLNYRLYSLRQPLQLSWVQLYRQFGASPAKADKWAVRNFRSDALRELRKLRIAWPELDYELPSGHLLLRPTRPRIAPPADCDSDPERTE